jgi:predicted DNA-binding transcriptional regulator AlpA
MRSERKLIAESSRPICAVCGKPVYSRAGIHPQCAMSRALGLLRALRVKDHHETLPSPSHEGEPKDADDNPDQLSIRQCAKATGVSPRVLFDWIQTGAWPLPTRTILGTHRYKTSDVRRWLLEGLWPCTARFRVQRSGLGVSLPRATAIRAVPINRGRNETDLIGE